MHLRHALTLIASVSILISATAEAKLRQRKNVMNHTLIRAGGPGGMRSLPNEILTGLCNEGVRTVFYLYPDNNFSNQGVHRCASGSLRYLGGGFRGASLRPVLEAIQRSAMNGEGPVLVHCWNGSHAAGEVAAYSLMQFCDWSGEEAAKYWASTLHDKQNLGKYGSVVNRIKKFQPLSGLRLSDSVKAKVCP